VSKRLIKFLIKQNTNKKKTTRTKRTNLTQAKSIGIIYHCSLPKHEDIIQELIQGFTNENKKVYSIEFLEKNNNLEFKLKEPNHYFLKEKDFNLLGLPKKNHIKNFVEHNYDVLINLVIFNNPVVHYLVSISKAEIKAGFLHKGYEAPYDLIINANTEESYKDAVTNIFNYLNLINNNEI
jgi:hypothetical protein